ncbi:polyisoprenoid-binding protein [Psychrobacter sp. YP14]|nr:polyisoprenoid-binding protein [Psychrobacter sp. YP14]
MDFIMPITTTPVLSVVTACALLSLPLLATAATPQKWQINPQKTKVGFSVPYLKKSIIEGTFHKIEGVINYDESRPQNTVIRFTVYTDSVDTDLKPRDYFIRRKELLNTKQYPTLKFTSSSVKLNNPREGYVNGSFNALGQTKPMTVKVNLTDVYTLSKSQPSALKFKATATINRHDYGVTAFPGIFGTTIPIVITGELMPAK